MKKVSALAGIFTITSVLLVGCGDKPKPKPKPEQEAVCNQYVCVSPPEYDCAAKPPAMIIVVVRKKGVSLGPYVVEVFNSDGSRFGSAAPILDDVHPHGTEVVFQEHPLIVFSGATDLKEIVRYTFDITKCETTTA